MKKYLIWLCLLVIVEIGLSLYLTMWREHFWDAISSKQGVNFLVQLGVFTGIALFLCLTNGITGYLLSLTTIEWRNHLNTKALQVYGKDIIMQSSKEIKDFPRYYVTEEGRIYSNYRFKFAELRPSISKSGYYQLQLTKNKKQYNKLVHRLVAEAYLSNKKDIQTQINHKDGNKLNNTIANLEWCTSSHNNQHAYDTGLNTCLGIKNSQAKLTAEQVLEIRKLYPSISIKTLSKKYNVTYSNILSIVRGKSWKHLL